MLRLDYVLQRMIVVISYIVHTHCYRDLSKRVAVV